MLFWSGTFAAFLWLLLFWLFNTFVLLLVTVFALLLRLLLDYFDYNDFKLLFIIFFTCLFALFFVSAFLLRGLFIMFGITISHGIVIVYSCYYPCIIFIFFSYSILLECKGLPFILNTYFIIVFAIRRTAWHSFIFSGVNIIRMVVVYPFLRNPSWLLSNFMDWTAPSSTSKNILYSALILA